MAKTGREAVVEMEAAKESTLSTEKDRAAGAGPGTNHGARGIIRDLFLRRSLRWFILSHRRPFSRSFLCPSVVHFLFVHFPQASFICLMHMFSFFYELHFIIFWFRSFDVFFSLRIEFFFVWFFFV